MRRSEPFVEPFDGTTDVWPGDTMERDDGWWRAHRVVTWSLPDDPAFGYRSEVEWRPIYMTQAEMGESPEPAVPSATAMAVIAGTDDKPAQREVRNA